ncbi:MAG: zinc ribbon domain-containing protein [Xanthomonadales bacterium]|nr:zinc ribbon domain-containing protein [Xanthomonadales bacterium]
MPIYEYRAVEAERGCDHCRSGFDTLQRLSEDPLVECPECGCAIQRIVSAPYVQSGSKHVLKEDNLSRHGFTQYKRAGEGYYEKTAGKGPNTIADDGK